MTTEKEWALNQMTNKELIGYINSLEKELIKSKQIIKMVVEALEQVYVVSKKKEETLKGD